MKKFLQLLPFLAVCKGIAYGIEETVAGANDQIGNAGGNHAFNGAADTEAAAYNAASILLAEFPIFSGRLGAACNPAHLFQKEFDEVLPGIQRRRGSFLRIPGHKVLKFQTVNAAAHEEGRFLFQEASKEFLHRLFIGNKLKKPLHITFTKVNTLEFCRSFCFSHHNLKQTEKSHLPLIVFKMAAVHVKSIDSPFSVMERTERFTVVMGRAENWIDFFFLLLIYLLQEIIQRRPLFR